LQNPCSLFSEFHVLLFSLFHHQQGGNDYRRKTNQWGEVPETCDDPCELFNREGELTQNQLVTAVTYRGALTQNQKLSSSHPIILYTSWSASCSTSFFKRSPPQNLPVPRTNQSNQFIILSNPKAPYYQQDWRNILFCRPPHPH
jgi:hypothetical protein